MPLSRAWIFAFFEVHHVLVRVDNHDIAILSVRKNLEPTGWGTLGWPTGRRLTLGWSTISVSVAQELSPGTCRLRSGRHQCSPGFAILPDEKMYFKRAP